MRKSAGKALLAAGIFAVLFATAFAVNMTVRWLRGGSMDAVVFGALLGALGGTAFIAWTTKLELPR